VLRALASFAVPLLLGVWLSLSTYHSELIGNGCLILAAAIAALAIAAETPPGKRWQWLQRWSGLRSPDSFEGKPFEAPVRYQVRQLRQAVAKVAEVTDEIDFRILEAALSKHPRTGVDPMYEPLHPYLLDEGLAQLVIDGTLEPVNVPTMRYKIIKRR